MKNALIGSNSHTTSQIFRFVNQVLTNAIGVYLSEQTYAWNGKHPDVCNVVVC